MTYNKMKDLFFNPSSFFVKVSKETKYWDALKIFIISYIIVNLFRVIGIWRLGISASSLYIIQIVLLAFILPFILSALFHIPIRIFGGKSGYLATFKSVTYGSLIFLTYQFVVSLILSVYYLVTDYSTLYPGIYDAINYALGGKPGLEYMSPLYSPMAFLLLIGVIHLFLILIKGINVLHKISLIRSVLAVLIGEVVIYGIYFGLVLIYWYLIISSLPF